MLQRRHVLGAAAAIGLARPALARPALAQPARVLKFIPQSNLTAIDPIWTTAYVTRNHALMIWDTLWGLDDRLEPQPQMVEGALVENEGRRWLIALRHGLKWHDGTPVRAA